MNELVDVVTATPTGPVQIVAGGSLDVTGRFTLDGPSGLTVTDRAMSWSIVPPSAPPFGFGSEDPVVENTPYTKTCPGAAFPTVGIYHITVTVQTAFDPPGVQTVDSNTITVNVLPIRGEGEIDLPATAAVASLPPNSGDATLPPNAGTVSLPLTSGVAEIAENEETL